MAERLTMFGGLRAEQAAAYLAACWEPSHAIPPQHAEFNDGYLCGIADALELLTGGDMKALELVGEPCRRLSDAGDESGEMRGWEYFVRELWAEAERIRAARLEARDG